MLMMMMVMMLTFTDRLLAFDSHAMGWIYGKSIDGRAFYRRLSFSSMVAVTCEMGEFALQPE
jgi:hypothetical protein